MSLLGNHGLIDDIGLQVNFVSVGAVAVVGPSASINVPYPAITFGLQILQISVAETAASPGTPSGWTLLFADTDGSFIKHYLFFKYSTGDTGSLNVAFSPSVGSVSMGRIHTFQNSILSPPISESGGLVVGSLTYGPASITSTRRRSLAVSFVFLPAQYSTGSYTGNTGGTWVEAATANTATGIGSTIQLQVAVLPIPGTISGGSYAADTGGLSLTRSFCIKSNL